MEIIEGLVYYGFIVNTIASDGALWNKVANKKLATLTTQDILINNQIKPNELKRTGFQWI